MIKLHEILAIEADKEGIAKRIMTETTSVFKNKHQLFLGSTKALKMDASGFESLEAASSEVQEIKTTVTDRLDYTAKAISDWLNIVEQKECTNQSEAKADLVIDETILATNVPATFLLGLETKLKGIRHIYQEIPTLSPGIIWEKDETGIENTFRAKNPEIRTKTQKQPQYRVLYEATKEHPAQIDKWNDEVVIGRYTTQYISGMITSAAKAKFLSRIDTLIQAVKQARQRANSVEAVKSQNIGQSIFEYINE